MFGSKLKTNKITTPLVKGEHPEIYDSAFLEEEGIQQYQLLIGLLQWAILLGRFNIAVVIMTMSVFRSAPAKKGKSRLSQTNLWLPFQDEAFSHSNPH
jgi:hypothetical protein